MEMSGGPTITSLVTGATGFLGRHLVEYLTRQGMAVTGVCRRLGRDPAPDPGPEAEDLPGTQTDLRAGSTPPTEVESSASEGKRPELRFLAVDVRDRRGLASVFERVRPDLVFHLAGSRRRDGAADSLDELVSTNVYGTANVLACALEAGCKRVLVAGTAEEYGPIPAPFRESDREEPSTVYGASKLAATRLAIAFASSSGLPVTVVRAAVAYGPGQGKDMLVGAACEALRMRRHLPMTAGTQTRDFIYVTDLVEGMVRAALTPSAAGRIINLGTGVATPVRELARLLEEFASTRGVLGLGELPMRPGEILDYVVDTSLAEQILGWRPRIGLREGLALTLESAGLLERRSIGPR